MADYPFDLGTYTRPVSTASPTAQAWFDRGLVWSYGFNHEESVRCFELAVEHDPGCALAHWASRTPPARTTTRTGTPSTPSICMRRCGVRTLPSRPRARPQRAQPTSSAT